MEGWTFDAETGQIRDAEGWALATVPHAIAGDKHDLDNGRLMAAAPALAAQVGRLCDLLWEAAQEAGDTRAGQRWALAVVEARGLLSDLDAAAVAKR